MPHEPSRSIWSVRLAMEEVGHGVPGATTAGGRSYRMSRPGEVLDALEAWRAARRALDETPNGTADWLRLRMVERDLRLAYERLNTEHARTVYDVVAEPDGPYWVMRVEGGPEVMTKAVRLDDAEEAVRDVIAVVDDIDRDAFEIDLDIDWKKAPTS